MVDILTKELLAPEADFPMRRAVISSDNLVHNIKVLRAKHPQHKIMIIVKADAYGHGAIICAKTAVSAGADAIGVADIYEALELRRAGVTGTILAWLHAPSEDFLDALQANISIAVSGVDELLRVRQALAFLRKSGGAHPTTAKIHIKRDLGLSRNGLTAAEEADFLVLLKDALSAGDIVLEGVMGHLSNASPVDDNNSLAIFADFVARLEMIGIKPDFLHVAASHFALTRAQAPGNMLRIGIAFYGLSPVAGVSASEFGLKPVMRLEASVLKVKRIYKGDGVSYDYVYKASKDTDIALISFGYADGLPRLASGGCRVVINGVSFAIVGKVAMDQFMVDLSSGVAVDGSVVVEKEAMASDVLDDLMPDSLSVAPGDTVVLWGDPYDGFLSVDDFASICDTINYEMVTRLGRRVQRVLY